MIGFYYWRTELLRKDGAKVGGHNLLKIEFTDKYIKLIGIEFTGVYWIIVLNKNSIEYLTIIPMEEEK